MPCGTAFLALRIPVVIFRTTLNIVQHSLDGISVSIHASSCHLLNRAGNLVRGSGDFKTPDFWTE